MLDAAVGINENALDGQNLRIAHLLIEKSSILTKSSLTKAEIARLAEINAEIGALRTGVHDLNAAVESAKAALISLTTSYQVERRRLGCV